MTVSRLTIFALLFFATPAFAQVQGPMSAIQFQDMCNSSYDVDVGLCAGYVSAIADKIRNDSNPMRATCLSPAISPEVLVNNLRREWTLEPPQPNDQAYWAVEGALRRRFRCT